MSKEWITVKECIGLPGFPTTAPAIRQRLDDLSANKSELKRKRSGSKAYEYHVSILPKYAQSSFIDDQHIEDLDANGDEGEQKKIHNNNELNEIWSVIFKLLTPQQQKDCIELFKNHGLSALLPAIVAPQTRQTAAVEGTETLASYSPEVINTAILLNDLPEEKRREILLAYGVEEHDGAMTLLSQHKQHKAV